MLAHPIEDEGVVSERPSGTQPTPSPPHPSTDQHETQPDQSPEPSHYYSYFLNSIPEVSGWESWRLVLPVTDQAKKIKHLKAQIKKLTKKAKPVITHTKSWNEEL
ncbi:hypothetical protein Tco_0548352 [Tanacetum coccineum]